MELDITKMVDGYIKKVADEFDAGDREKHPSGYKFFTSVIEYHRTMPDINPIKVYPHHMDMICRRLGLVDNPLYCDEKGDFIQPDLTFDDCRIEVISEP